jgi:hypothetical protein
LTTVCTPYPTPPSPTIPDHQSGCVDFLAVWVRDRCSPPALPANTDPFVQLVLINGTGKHQQPVSDQVRAPPAYTAEPSTGNHTSTFGADIVPALRNFPKMIDQRLQFSSFALSSASP